MAIDFGRVASNAIDIRMEEITARMETAACPDQYVGKLRAIAQNGNISKIDRKSIPLNARDTFGRCLIIILESPHIKEFIPLNESGPAKGSTGIKIANHIGDVQDELKQCLDDDFGLILINAVQHQCSLGIPTDCFRDTVFLHAWKNGGEADFLTRLRNAYRKGDVIANCCTKGNLKDGGKRIELRQLVQDALGADFGVVAKKTHPSSWPKHRNETW